MEEMLQARPAPMPRLVRLIAFDLDGTLADTFEDITRVTNAVLKTFECPALDKPTIMQYVGRGAHNLMRQALGPDKEAFTEAATLLWREEYERHPTDYTTLYPGVVALLDWLRAKDVRTAILSNKLDGLTRQIAQNMGLAERVDAVRGETEAFARKPDPAVLHHFLELYGVRPEAAVMVGDSRPDFELAANAGVAFCGVLTGKASREDFQAMDARWIVDTLEVLHQQLEASGACQR